jgi:hypothetical protein
MINSLILISLVFSSFTALAESACYERKYSSQHMLQHKGQSLVRIKLRMTEDFILIEAIAAKDSKEYSFWADLPVLNTNIMCAAFSADGEQYNGCLSVRQVEDDAVLISPIAMNYVSSGQEMISTGLNLIRCEGNSSDGEGCETGKLRTISLLPHNSEDAVYKLFKTDCP